MGAELFPARAYAAHSGWSQGYRRQHHGGAARHPLFQKVWLYVLIGVGTGAAIHNWIPERVITGLLGEDNWWLVLVATLIGIPAFTRNWLSKHGVSGRSPPAHTHFDALVIGITAAAFLSWIFWADANLPGLLLVGAGVLQAARLSRWRGLSTARDPLVFVLHAGYAWVPAGQLLLGASLLGAPIAQSAAIHALTAGAMASMILAVMTRATLGHTGRELKASTATIVIYIMVNAGALLRVGASLGLAPYLAGMEISAILWGGAFLLFIIAYGPILLGPRVDGRPY